MFHGVALSRCSVWHPGSPCSTCTGLESASAPAHDPPFVAQDGVAAGRILLAAWGVLCRADAVVCLGWGGPRHHWLDLLSIWIRDGTGSDWLSYWLQLVRSS